MMDMDIDNSSDSSSSSSSHDAIQAALIADSSKNGDIQLGGSISRSARLRATTTDDDEEEEEGDEEDDDDNDDDDEDNHRTAAHSHLKARHGRRAALNPRPSAFVTASRGERVLAQSSKPAKTSAAKLSDAFPKPCSQKELVKLLIHQSTAPKGKATSRQLRVLEEAYIQLFSQWTAELAEGFMLLFYGLGSKIRLLNLFVNRALRSAVADRRVLVLDGFKADISVLDLTAALESILVPEEERHKDPLYSSKSAARIDERVTAILDKLDLPHPYISPNRPIYLLVHSIDGPSMRSPRSQATLWTLASHPRVRLLASFDHTKAPLLFPVSASSAGGGMADASSRSILYHHIPTLRPYAIETLASGCMSAMYPPSIFLSDLHLLHSKQGGMRGASSSSRAEAAAFVLASLTQKAKDLFQMIAARQIANADGSGQIAGDSIQGTPSFAMPYSTIFGCARDAFLANNVGQMEALLREFRDHEVVLSSNIAPVYADADFDQEQEQNSEVGQRNNEWIWIHIDADDLQSLADKLQV